VSISFASLIDGYQETFLK